MYKDKEQQREANRLAAQRRRDKGMTQDTAKGMTIEGMTRIEQPVVVTPIRSRTTGPASALPGDEDYVGACAKIDGVWRVNEDIEQPSLKDMTRQQLADSIQAYPNDQWVNKPAHTELLRRLRAWSIDKLEQLGYSIPAWKRAA